MKAIAYGGRKQRRSNRQAKGIALFLCCLFLFGLITFPVKIALSAAPKLISFQGKLTSTGDGSNVANGAYDMQFKLYDAQIGGNLLWSETWDSASQKVLLVNGVFNVKLGSFTSLSQVDFSSGSLFLSVNFNPGTGYDGEMSPRKQITSSPFALSANSLDGDGNINLQNTNPNKDAANINYNPASTSGKSALVVQSGTNASGAAIKIIANNSSPALLIGQTSLTGPAQTYIGANPSNFAGNFLDFQINGQSKFTVSASGQLAVSGSIIAGAGGAFQISQNGDLIKIKGVNYSFPSGQGTNGQVLTNDGSGNLNWADAPSGGGGGNSGWADDGLIVRLSSSTDNVGIGTSAPITKLGLQTATNAYGLSHTDGTVIVSSWVGNAFGSNIGMIGTKSNQSFALFAGSSGPRLTVSTSGNIGINNTAPYQRLTISGSNGQNQIAIDQSGAALGVGGLSTFNNGVILASAGDIKLRTNITYNNNWSATGTDRLVIQAGTGNVGIGVSSPTQFFSIGLSEGFQVSQSGNLTKINGIKYSFPSEQGAAGQYLTNDGNGNLSWTSITQAPGTPVLVEKDADETLTNSATLQEDDYLKFIMQPNTAYVVELIAKYTASKAADFKYGFNAPESSTFRLYGESWLSTSNSNPCNITSPATVCVNSGGQDQDWTVQVRGLVQTAAAGGQFVFHWAQNSSSGDAVTVYKNSALKYTQLAGLADLAEIYYTNEKDLEGGDAVILDESLMYGVKKATKERQDGILGIISTNPALIIGQASTEGLPVPLALSGRVPLKVNIENGPIKPGDWLAISKQNGTAGKALPGESAFAMALEKFENPTPGKIEVFLSRKEKVLGISTVAENNEAVDPSALLMGEGLRAEQLVIFGGGIKTGQIAPLELNSILQIFGKTFFQDQIYLSSNGAGYGQITAGQTETRIIFSTDYLSPPVINISLISDNPAGLPDGLIYSVGKISISGFTVYINKSAGVEVNFSWMAFGMSQNPKDYNPPPAQPFTQESSQKELPAIAPDEAVIKDEKTDPVKEMSEMPTSDEPPGAIVKPEQKEPVIQTDLPLTQN